MGRGEKRKVWDTAAAVVAAAAAATAVFVLVLPVDDIVFVFCGGGERRFTSLS